MSRKRLLWEIYLSCLFVMGISLLIFHRFGERHLFVPAAIMVVLGGVLTLMIYRRIARPLVEMRRVA